MRAKLAGLLDTAARTRSLLRIAGHGAALLQKVPGDGEPAPGLPPVSADSAQDLPGPGGRQSGSAEGADPEPLKRARAPPRDDLHHRVQQQRLQCRSLDVRLQRGLTRASALPESN